MLINKGYAGNLAITLKVQLNAVAAGELLPFVTLFGARQFQLSQPFHRNKLRSVLPLLDKTCRWECPPNGVRRVIQHNNLKPVGEMRNELVEKR